MLKNYFTIALRNFLRYKGNSLINIAGLAIGISVFLLIFQYVAFELSYEDFYEHSDRIYRIRNDRIYSDKHDKSAGCPPAVAPTVKKEFPEVLEAARLYGTDVTFIGKNKKISEYLEKVYYAEDSFLKIFSIPFLNGNAETALEEPYAAIISESMSQKYFGNGNPVNKEITLENEYGNHQYKISGVFKDTLKTRM